MRVLHSVDDHDEAALGQVDRLLKLNEVRCVCIEAVNSNRILIL